MLKSGWIFSFLFSNVSWFPDMKTSSTWTDITSVSLPSSIILRNNLLLFLCIKYTYSDFLGDHLVFGSPHHGSFLYYPWDAQNILDFLREVQDFSQLYRFPSLLIIVNCDLWITLHILPIYDCRIYLIFFNFSCFSSCMWYAMMHCCLPDILLGILPCHSLKLLHIIWPLTICCQHHHISLSCCTSNQPPCGPISTVVTFSVESRFLLLFFISFILISLEIWRSVYILATLVACALEELALVLFLVSSV